MKTCAILPRPKIAYAPGGCQSARGGIQETRCGRAHRRPFQVEIAPEMDWITLSLAAGLFQATRNAVMKRLGHELDEYINVFGRFLFLL